MQFADVIIIATAMRKILSLTFSSKVLNMRLVTKKYFFSKNICMFGANGISSIYLQLTVFTIKISLQKQILLW